MEGVSWDRLSLGSTVSPDMNRELWPFISRVGAAVVNKGPAGGGSSLSWQRARSGTMAIDWFRKLSSQVCIRQLTQGRGWALSQGAWLPTFVALSCLKLIWVTKRRLPFSF